MRRRLVIGTLFLAITSTSVQAGKSEYVSSYSGQEKRTIKSLSKDDIEQLNAGKGWGLAKAAELNGMPGKHKRNSTNDQ